MKTNDALLRRVARDYDLPFDLVANEDALKDYIVESVVAEEKSPSEMLELYCERNDIPECFLMEYAIDDLGYDPYDGMKMELDAVYDGECIDEMFGILDAASGRRRLNNSDQSNRAEGTTTT